MRLLTRLKPSFGHISYTIKFKTWFSTFPQPKSPSLSSAASQVSHRRKSSKALPPNRQQSKMADDLGGVNPAHIQVEDKASFGHDRRRDRNKGGGGGRGGGRPQDRNMLVSKALSKLLRHQAENAGIRLDEGGWAPLDKVLAYGPIKSLKVTLEDVNTVIATSDKTRFALKPKTAPGGQGPAADPPADASSLAPASEAATGDPADWLIRANQGHSIRNVDSAALLRPITLEAGNAPPTVYHGTYLATWPAIEATGGLKRMGRNHVHFATALPEDMDRAVSGMRRDSELFVRVDVEAALRDGGTTWWISENGVVLTEGDADGVVPCRYFSEVFSRVDGVPTLWKDGVKVGEIPEGVRMRIPPGGRRGGGGPPPRGGRGGGHRGRGRGRGRGATVGEPAG